MSAVDTPAYEWKDLDWRAIERRTFKLQKRIYRASSRGAVQVVHKLQRLLMASWSAKCLAVRKVTQDNRGKRTAGVDGVKNLSPTNRMRLGGLLDLRAPAKPARRVWIPKPGTGEKRGLAIPVIRDRAPQSIVKLALEPEWEAQFEANSYGFRPGRSAHDAQAAIFTAIRLKPKFVLDADIAKCYDRINHAALLGKLQTFPTLRRAVKGWLDAGIMDRRELFPTSDGVPQGGCASPLLANVALHGLETAVTAAFPKTKTVAGRTVDPWRPIVIRYADDLVVLHEDRGVIDETRRIIETWLKGIGLELKPSKTRITHTLTATDGQVGFDFLGWNVRQHPVGRTHSGKKAGGQRLGFKTIITPSKDAQQRHQAHLADVIRHHQAVTQAALIGKLNPVIRGWVNYHATGVAKSIFAKMDALTFAKLLRWAKRRHPTKPAGWVTEHYWHHKSGPRWNFSVTDGPQLCMHKKRAIVRHIKVRGRKSPYDGDWAYWGERLGRYPDLPAEEARLLKRQQGRCSWCGLHLTSEDRREIDHIQSLARGGDDVSSNRQLLHGHCHDAKTARDNARATEVPMTEAG
jgi:RNA-directed DNA polymerase